MQCTGYNSSCNLRVSIDFIQSNFLVKMVHYGFSVVIFFHGSHEDLHKLLKIPTPDLPLERLALEWWLLRDLQDICRPIAWEWCYYIYCILTRFFYCEIGWWWSQFSCHVEPLFLYLGDKIIEGECVKNGGDLCVHWDVCKSYVLVPLVVMRVMYFTTTACLSMCWSVGVNDYRYIFPDTRAPTLPRCRIGILKLGTCDGLGPLVW